MTSLVKEQFDGFHVTYEDSDEVRAAVFERVMRFFIETELFSGESVCQSDSGLAESPVVLSDIADDIIKFNLCWEDD